MRCALVYLSSGALEKAVRELIHVGDAFESLVNSLCDDDESLGTGLVQLQRESFL